MAVMVGYIAKILITTIQVIWYQIIVKHGEGNTNSPFVKIFASIAAILSRHLRFHIFFHNGLLGEAHFYSQAVLNCISYTIIYRYCFVYFIKLTSLRLYANPENCLLFVDLILRHTSYRNAKSRSYCYFWLSSN